MVWRQGYYLNSVWQRGRYEEMSSAAAALSPAPPGTHVTCCGRYEEMSADCRRACHSGASYSVYLLY